MEFYGKYKAKLSDDLWEKVKDNEDGKLVLVTAINPTPAGEGKTTTSVGLGQAMAQLNKKAIIALREPSLGPCFGIKGGAAGGGLSLIHIYPGEELDNVSNIFSYLAEAKRLAKYEVLDATKNEEGYKVKVKVEPADVFEKWKEHLDIETVKIQAEKVGYGIDESLAEFLRIAITENTYEEPREIEVQVIEDEKDVYIEMSQMEALDYALFPQRVHERVILAMFTCPNAVSYTHLLRGQL